MVEIPDDVKNHIKKSSKIQYSYSMLNQTTSIFSGTTMCSMSTIKYQWACSLSLKDNPVNNCIYFINITLI